MAAVGEPQQKRGHGPPTWEVLFLQVRRPARFTLVAVAMALATTTAHAGEPPVALAPLERACSACHGASTDGPPLAALLDGARRNRPAEGSRLFAVLVSRHAGAAAVKAKWPDWPSAAEIAAVMAWLDGDPPPGSTPVSAAAAVSPPRLALATDRLTYRTGGEIRVHAAATEACHLTLISIDPEGRALLLFPNDRERDNAIEPGTTRTIPGPDAGYRLRAREVGRERVIAWCTKEPSPLAGLRFAFDTQRFATLGRWPDVLAQMIATSANAEAGTPAKARRGRTEPEPVSLFADHAMAALAFEVTP